MEIDDLPGAMVGYADGSTIVLDVDAAGHGWFVDATPGDDSEFDTAGDQGEQQRVDLLTTIMHELGHVLGLEHGDDDELMEAHLATGIRKLPHTHVDHQTAAASAADLEQWPSRSIPETSDSTGGEGQGERLSQFDTPALANLLPASNVTGPPLPSDTTGADTPQWEWDDDPLDEDLTELLAESLLRSRKIAK